MIQTANHTVLCFQIDACIIGLPLTEVIRLELAALPSPVPDSPPELLGLLNVGSELVPVFSLRRALGLPARELATTDLLVLAWAGERKVALVVEQAIGLRDLPATTEPVVRSMLPEGTVTCLAGAVTAAEGVILIVSIARFLHLFGETRLDALTEAIR